MSEQSQVVNAAELSLALSKQRMAKAVVAEAGVALVRGAATLVSALLQDTRTLIAKIPGNITDQIHVHANFATSKQLDAFFTSVEDFTGRTYPKTKEAMAFMFSKVLGSSPTDTFAMGAAVFGAGTVGRFVTNHLNGMVNDMSMTLTEVGFNGALGISNDSLVIGMLAVAGVSAMLLEMRYKPRLKAQGFEADREKQRAELTELAIKTGAGILLPSEELADKFAKFKSKFDEDKKLSPETLADISAMRASGASDLELSNRISWSPDELRWAKPIYSRLTEEYLMTAPEAATIAHALIINTDGDLPLIKKRLQSHVLPEEWTTQYGFKPGTYVDKIPFKDRPSELLKLGAAGVSGARKLFDHTVDRIMERFGSPNTAAPAAQSNQQEKADGSTFRRAFRYEDCGMSSTFESDGYREGFAGGQARESRESVHDDEYARGYEAGVEDREQCNLIAATVIDLLDGEPITQFKSFDEFKDWLDTVNAYEEWDQEPENEERNSELLEMVYAKLVEASQEVAAKKSSGMRLG